MSDTDKIFADARKPATMHNGGHSTNYYTLQEAVIAWNHLPDNERTQATIEVSGGPIYTAKEIELLHHK